MIKSLQSITLFQLKLKYMYSKRWINVQVYCIHEHVCCYIAGYWWCIRRVHFLPQIGQLAQCILCHHCMLIYKQLKVTSRTSNSLRLYLWVWQLCIRKLSVLMERNKNQNSISGFGRILQWKWFGCWPKHQAHLSIWQWRSNVPFILKFGRSIFVKICLPVYGMIFFPNFFYQFTYR